MQLYQLIMKLYIVMSFFIELRVNVDCLTSDPLDLTIYYKNITYSCMFYCINIYIACFGTINQLFTTKQKVILP